MSRRTTLLVAAGATALLAVPASASAVTATLNQPCYSHVPTKGSDPIVVTLTGGTPGADFLVAATVPGKGLGSAGSASGTFDAAGNGTAQVTDVFPPSGSIDPIKGQAVTLTVEDFGSGPNPADTPIGQALITNVALSVSGKPSNPRSARRVTVSGTLFAGQPIYGFIVKGSSKHVLRRISLGKGNVCGYTSAKAIVAPGDFHSGTYKLYINAGRTLNKSKAIFGSFRITTRVF